MTAALDLDKVTAVLSPKQIRSIVDAGTTPQIALWSGAVSSGKTIASLIAFLIAVAVAPEHGLIVMMGKTRETIERNLIEPLQSTLLFGVLSGAVRHTRGASTATILGRTVHLIGANDIRAEDRIRGMTIALAYVDEATILPRGFWMMLLSRLRVVGARLLATTNPDNPAHWLRRDFMLRAAEVGMRWWHFTLDDNPSLTAEYVARLKLQYVGLWYRRFILGQWVQAEGAVYDMFDPDRHVLPFEQVPVIRRWLGVGVDYGTVNPFNAVLGGIGADSRIYVVSEYRHDSRLARRQLTDPELSAGLRTWLAGVRYPTSRLLGVTPEVICVDPSAASFKVQLYRDGMPAANASNAVEDGIRTVSALLGADRLRIVDSCKALVDEMPAYAWDDKAAERGEDQVIKVNDHSMDSLRYLLHTTRNRWRGEVLPALSDTDSMAA